MDFNNFFEQTERELREELEIRKELGDERSIHGEIILLGQLSLLANQSIKKDLLSELKLFATTDIDVLVKGEWVIQKALRKISKQFNLEFDELSSEIWIPADAQFIAIYEGEIITVKAIDPESAILTKAIKAKEKNRILVRDALRIYGSQLANRITENGGDLSYFDYSK
jgi:hypothetical protein